MRRRERHPVLEAAVFAAALLLAGFIARELWARRPQPAPVEPQASSAVPVPLNPARPGVSKPIVQGPPERAATKVGRIRGAKPGTRRRKTDVPPPK